MSLNYIFVFIAAAFIIRLTPKPEIRRWLIMICSILVVYWLQPALAIRYLDFILPTALVLISIIGWLYGTPKADRFKKENTITFLVVFLSILLINLTRFLSIKGLITPSRPPQLWVFLLVAGISGLVFFFSKGKHQGAKTAYYLIFGIIISLLVCLKSPVMQQTVIHIFDGGKIVKNTTIQWLGFSYISFRILHTLIDYRSKRLKDITLQEYLIFILFFPAITAGPIDRFQKFKTGLYQKIEPFDSKELLQAVWRIFLGVFKKFAVADTLAIIAINNKIIWQVNDSKWILIFLYAYSFQILFDFSGYTDIAIGIGRLMGFQLPENFNYPYLKPNLKLFWDNWHMTLTQWFRTYYFNPISRKFRRKFRNLHVSWMVLTMQLSTMLLIGLWHGITINFIFWGLWHGIGLFIQNRWAFWITPKLSSLERRWVKPAYHVFGVILTFHYVMLGWVWFAMPTMNDSIRVFQILFSM